MDAAELIVVDELRNPRMGSAHRAIRILSELQLTEAHPQGIDNEKAADQRVTRAKNELDCLGRLNDTDNPWQDAEDAPFRTARHEARRRWFGIKTPIAWTVFGGE